MKVLSDFVFIIPDKVREKTESGIFIPVGAGSTPVSEGTVEAAGESLQLKKGDRVVFPPGVGFAYENGIFLRFNSLFAIND